MPVTITPDDLPGIMRQLRQSANLTQRELAGRIYVTPAAVCHWEKGIHKCPFAALTEWAGGLGYRVQITLVPDRESGI